MCHPVVTRVSINSPLLLRTIVMPTFFGTTWVRLTHLLSKIGKMTPTSSSFSTSFLTTSCKVGFRCLFICLTGFASSSRKILWVQIDASITLRSVMVSPISPLSYRNRFFSLPSCYFIQGGRDDHRKGFSLSKKHILQFLRELLVSRNVPSITPLLTPLPKLLLPHKAASFLLPAE